MSRILALFLSLLVQASPGAGAPHIQELEIRPSRVHTGQVFQLRVRIRAPHGLRPELPDSFPEAPGLVPAGSVEVRIGGPEGGGEGDGQVEAVYPVQALRPGRLDLPPLRVRLEEEKGAAGEGESSWHRLSLGRVTVYSVLPDGAGTPDPAGPVRLSPTGRGGWAGVLALLGGLVAAVSGLAIRWRGWRSENEVAPEPPSPWPEGVSPEVARGRLETMLHRCRAGGGGSEVPWEEALILFRRVILARVPGGDEAMTTREILALPGWTGTPEAERLGCILDSGDVMRFGGGAVPTEEARSLLDRISDFLEAGHV